jgi:hypothetical protein
VQRSALEPSHTIRDQPTGNSVQPGERIAAQLLTPLPRQQKRLANDVLRVMDAGKAPRRVRRDSRCVALVEALELVDVHGTHLSRSREKFRG